MTKRHRPVKAEEHRVDGHQQQGGEERLTNLETTARWLTQDQAPTRESRGAEGLGIEDSPDCPDLNAGISRSTRIRTAEFITELTRGGRNVWVSGCSAG
jgi:hypothetical protein